MWGAATSRPRIRALHFGLGDATKITSLTVRWPDGTETHEGAIAANQIVTVKPGG